jgi:hypothetical protein
LLVNILALVWGYSMLINFGWPRPQTNPPLSAGFTGTASWPVVGGAPIFELSIGLLLVVGLIYWLAVQRNKQLTVQHTNTPEPAPLTVGGP